MADTNLKCEFCLFWLDRNIMGVCRRFPATQNKHKNEWCGEFKGWIAPTTQVVKVEEVVEIVKRKPGRPKKNDPSAA